MELEKEIVQLQKELDTATMCGYGFIVGVSTQEHRRALLSKDPALEIVVTGCPR